MHYLPLCDICASAETRKHKANDPKCSELGWVCVPLAVETYGNWGKEARDTFSRLATRLAIGSPRSKSSCVYEVYSKLNPNLDQIYCESNNGPDSRILIYFICRYIIIGLHSCISCICMCI